MHLDPEDHRKLFLRFLAYVLIMIIVFFIESVFIGTEILMFIVTFILGIHLLYKCYRCAKF